MKKSDKMAIGQVLCEGDLLAQKQADFNENYIVKANDVLYGLLADIMAFVYEPYLSANSEMVSPGATFI